MQRNCKLIDVKYIEEALLENMALLHAITNETYTKST